MTFDFKIYNYNYDDRIGMLEKEASGVVKCKKEFPIYMEDEKEYIFKPLSKTKPLTTPLFAISEVFWSTVIKKYFDKLAPLYRLAICNGYDKHYPSKYSKGTIVESITKPKERLVNLLEYYNANEDDTVNIKDYINYCGIYYDYTDILNSSLFKERRDLGVDLAKQILISILKNDLNYHYENVAFIYEGNKLKSLAPPFDHEFSAPFLYPDNDLMNSYYFGAYNTALIQGYTKDVNINLKAIFKNIKFISREYPQVIKEFLIRLRCFIEDFQSSSFVIPKDYMEPLSTDLYLVYEAIYKEHEDSKQLHEIPKIELTTINPEELEIAIKRDVLRNAFSYYNNLKNTLDEEAIRKKRDKKR